MTYQELLLRKEWGAKCNRIIDRDKFTCQDCGVLGFHKNSYLRLLDVQKLDLILSDWRLKGEKISEFIIQKNFNYKYEVKNVPFAIIELENQPYIYEISLLGKVKGVFNIITLPTGLKAICDYEQSSVNAKLYHAGIVSNVSNVDANGSILLLEFEKKLSDYTYLNIEYHMKGTLDGNPIDCTLINITSNNYFLSLRTNPFDSGIKCLNVHHKYYIRGKNPWEYPDDAFVTLCDKCHQKRHQNGSIPLLDSNQKLITNLMPCKRCGGSGYLPQYYYYMKGICFECGGEGVVL